MNTRQNDILDLLAAQGEMTIKALAERLGVTEMTIHRDLDSLGKDGYLYKKRGAAVFIEKPDRGGGMYQNEKREIGRLAAEHIKPGQTVLFDNSTTAIETAKFLSGIPGLTFYTTNIEIAAIVSAYPGTVMYCSGGYYFPDSKGFVGRQVEEFVSRVKADICVIGASGISVDMGLTNPYPMHTALQRKIIEASDFRLVVADHSKFGKRAMEKAADLSEIDLILTDGGIRPDVLEEYGKYTKIETT